MYIYILKCADGSLYTGWTTNLERRITKHNKGQGAKYTRCRLPVELVYFEYCPTQKEAQCREYAIKQLTREQKIKLINKSNQAVNF